MIYENQGNQPTAIGLFLACNQPKQGPNMIVEGYEVCRS